MIYLYLILVIGLSVYETMEIKKKNGQKKEIFVFLGSMVLVAVFGVIYLANTFRPSIVGMLFDLLHVKG